MANQLTPRQQQTLLHMADRMAQDLQGYLEDSIDKTAPGARWTQHLVDQYDPLRKSISATLANPEGDDQ